MTIKEIPEIERPYEKLEMYGEKNLSNSELLAIIIKAGTKESTSIDIANKILNLNPKDNKGDLNFLKDLDLEELKKVKGVGRVKAIQIKALCELSNRMNKPSNYRKIIVKSPRDIAEILMNDLRFEKREIVKLITLNNKNVITRIMDVSLGGGNFANLDIKNVLSETIKMSSPQIILVHNHPSGDPTPSEKDFEVTKRVKLAASLLGIKLLDHIVIGNLNYESIILDKKWKTKLGEDFYNEEFI